MNPCSAPRKDGFTGHFYRSCWDNIKDDLLEMVIDFFKGGYLPSDVTDTKLILIPKVDHARSMGDFRPISIRNSLAKLISKMLASRLASILPTVVDEEQVGFVHERNISNDIVMAQELIRDLNRKSLGGNICIKLDMAKAYDRLEWRFLLHAWKAFGFSDITRNLIYRNIYGIGYFFYINGETVGRIKSFRGVLQRGQLSPVLFVLAQHIFSANFKRALRNNNITDFKVERGEMSISHILYADDVLIFSNGSIRSLTNLMGIIPSYEQSSGQMVNVSKSSFYLSPKSMARTPHIQRIIGISPRQFPITYLGVPIFLGK